MFTARISFLKGPSDAQAVSEAVSQLLGCWYKNGQIISADWAVADSGAGVEFYVTIPERESLEPVHNNRYASEELAALIGRGYGMPTVTILGSDPSQDAVCSCESPSALVLFTHYLSSAPPVRCLDCFRPVPLYRLPHFHDAEHLGLLQWAADYRACDTLQMHCTTGERFGEGQLYRHDSSLSRNGRDICARLEAVLRRPVYYWLRKVRSRSRQEELARRCPACGGAWRLEQRLFSLFDFRCEPCRLLSAIACDVS